MRADFSATRFQTAGISFSSEMPVLQRFIESC